MPHCTWLLLTALQELRTPYSRTPGSLMSGELPLAADLAADALQQLSIAAHPAGAASSSSSAAGSSAGGQQLLYMPAAAAAAASGSAVLGYQHGMGMGSSSGGSLAGMQQPMQAVQVVTPTGQQQVLLPMAVGQEEQQQLPAGLSPSGTPGMQQLAFQPQAAAGVALQPPGLVVVGQQPYAPAPARQQQLLLHQQHPQRHRHKHQGSYEQQQLTDEVGQQQLVMWQGLDASVAAAPGAAAAAVGAGGGNPGGMVLLPQQPMQPMMAAGQAWVEPSGPPAASAAGYMPYYALPLASMTAGSHMMMGAGGMQMQQPTSAQLMHMQQQQQQHMLVYAQPGDPSAAAAGPSNSASSAVQFALPLHVATGAGRAVHVPAPPHPHMAHVEGSRGYAAPSATAAADVSHYQLPPTGQW
jgi:hypothetical protein